MIGAALARLRRRPGPVLVLASLNLLFALLAAAPLSAPLARLLDDRPAAIAIADSPDEAARAELLEDHPELVSTAAETALLALAIYAALSWIACGGLLAESDPFAPSCARHAGRMLAVSALGLPLRLVALAGPLVAWPLTTVAHSFGALLAAGAVGVLVFGALWSLGTVTIDRARGAALAQPELSAWRSLRAGWSASRARLGDTLALAAFSGLGFAGVTALQVAITHRLASGSSLLVGAAVLGAVARATLTATTLLAANDGPSPKTPG